MVTLTAALPPEVVSEPVIRVRVLAVLTVATLCWVWYLRHLTVTPLREIITLLNQHSEGTGDLSHDVPVYTHDEIRELATSHNRFQGKLRDMINRIRQLAIHTAVESARLVQMSRQVSGHAQSQRTLSESVRSLSAADFCLKLGFRRVYNLTGGIDAWSEAVDSKVARY